MERNHKTIIGILVLIVVVLVSVGAFAASNSASYKTITFNDTGTTLSAPDSMELKTQLDQDGILSETYATSDGNIQIERRAIHNPLVAQILKYASDDGKSVKSTASGKIVRNESTGETFLIVSFKGDNQTVDRIAKSIKWGKAIGVAKSSDDSSSDGGNSGSGSASKTYPFYSDTGELIGYYSVGDTLSFKDYIFKLQPNGDWVMIGEAIGSSDLAFKAGYQSALDEVKLNETQQAETDSGSDDNDSSTPASDGNSSNV